MPRRSLLVAGLLFVLLAAVTWWLRREPAAPEAKPFFTLKGRTPDTVTVEFGPDTTVLVPRGKTGWQVVSPVDYPADALLVEATLKHLRDLVVQNVYPITPQKLDSYGFRVPRGLLRAAYADGRTPDSLIVGGFTPNGAYDYVRSGSEPRAGLLPSRITRSYFLKETRELRETQLLPVSETRVRRIELLGGGGAARTVLAMDDSENWRVLEPYPGPADGAEIREYLRSLNHMHIRDFVPGGRDRWREAGLEHPAVGVRLVSVDGSRLGAYLGGAGPNGQVYARGFAHPQVFLVPESYVPVLKRSADTFRRASVVTFGLVQADSVRVVCDAGSRSFDLAPSPPGAAPLPVRDVLGNWLLLKAEAFERAGAAGLRRRGLDPPRGRLVWWGGGDTLAVVEVGEDDGKDLAVRVTGGPGKRLHEILLIASNRARPLWSFIRKETAAAGG